MKVIRFIPGGVTESVLTIQETVFSPEIGLGMGAHRSRDDTHLPPGKEDWV